MYAFGCTRLAFYPVLLRRDEDKKIKKKDRKKRNPVVQHRDENQTKKKGCIVSFGAQYTIVYSTGNRALASRSTLHTSSDVT